MRPILPNPSTAMRLLRAIVCVAAMFCGLAAAQPEHVVTVNESGQGRAALFLDEDLSGMQLEVSLLGWRGSDGELQARLPEGLNVNYPPSLAPSPVPMLPLLVTGGDRPGLPGSLRLSFLMTGGGREQELEVLVRFAERAILELDVPDEVLAFRDGPTTISLRISNRGNAAATARLSFSGLPVSEPPVKVAAGATRTVMVELPPVAGDSRLLKVTLEGGVETVSESIRVTPFGSIGPGGYGLTAALAAQAKVAGGRIDGGYSVGARGQLSRTTYFDAGFRGEVWSVASLPHLRLQHRATMLELTEKPTSNPAGAVGYGLYLSQRFTVRAFFDELNAGLAVPFDWDAESPKLGLELNSSRFRSQASLDLSGRGLTAQASANLAPFHLSLRFTPEEQARWRGSLQYAGRELGAHLQADLGEAASRVSLSGRYSARLAPDSGPITFAVRLGLAQDQGFQASLQTSMPGVRLGIGLADGTPHIEGDFSLPLGAAELRGHAQLPLASLEAIRAGAGVTFPAGPLTLDLAGDWVTGDLELSGRAGYSLLFPGGTLSGEARLRAQSLNSLPSVSAQASASYASRRGFQANVSLAAPLVGEGHTQLTLGASYALFLATPPALALALDGPDPTAREVRVELLDGRGRTPLSGVRLSGCGSTETTGTTGTATLRGPGGICDVTVEAASLPAGTFIAERTIKVAPGASAVLEVQPTTSLRVLVRYRDVDSGEVLESGPSRQVRVVVDGPVARWGDVELPMGALELRDLPPGDYQVQLRGTTETRPVRLGLEPGEVLITLPAPRRSVLDPAAVTPPVRVELDPFIVGGGLEFRLTVSSPAPLSAVVVEVGGKAERYLRTAEEGPWVIKLPAPTEASGALSVMVTVEFEGGQVAQRTLQLIVTPGGGPSPPPGNGSPSGPAKEDDPTGEGGDGVIPDAPPSQTIQNDYLEPDRRSM